MQTFGEMGLILEFLLTQDYFNKAVILELKSNKHTLGVKLNLLLNSLKYFVKLHLYFHCLLLRPLPKEKNKHQKFD